jgi:hypothetical protein
MSASAAIRAPAPTARDTIHDLARRHGIRYERAAIDDWAEAVNRVAGDDVALDETEWLLVALGRAELVPDSENTLLHARYLAERDGADA